MIFLNDTAVPGSGGGPELHSGIDALDALGNPVVAIQQFLASGIFSHRLGRGRNGGFGAHRRASAATERNRRQCRANCPRQTASTHGKFAPVCKRSNLTTTWMPVNAPQAWVVG